MNTKHLLLVGMVFLLCGSLWAGTADETAAAEALAKRYGDRLKKVSATGLRRDDVELAEQILSDAPQAENPTLVCLMYDKVYELARKDKIGYATAIQAMHQKADVAPKRIIECYEKILPLRQKQFSLSRGSERLLVGDSYITDLLTLGKLLESTEPQDAEKHYKRALIIASSIKSDRKDTIRKRIEQAKAKSTSVRKVKSLAQELASNPHDRALRLDLVKVYITQLDQPQQAQKYLSPAMPELWRSYLPLLTKDPNTLPAEVAGELAQWYQYLQRQTHEDYHGTLILRQHIYWQRFLAGYPRNDTRKTDAKKQLAALAAKLDELGIEPPNAQWAGDAGALAMQTGPKAQRAIEQATRYLLGQQGSNGRWTPLDDNPHGFGPLTTSSLVSFALMHTGVDPNDKRIGRTMQEISRQPHSNTIYNALSVLALVKANATLQDPKYSAVIGQRIRRLTTGTADGSFGKDTDPKNPNTRGNPYESQWVIFAVSQAAEAGIKVPESFWKLCLKWWTDAQNSDGGWAHRPGLESRHVSTLAGAVSMLLCMEKLGFSRSQALSDSRIKQALGWVDANFDNGKNRDPLNYLYLLTRLGVARGTTKFNGKLWYRYAADPLIRRQDREGFWKPSRNSRTLSTALGLMVLDTPRRK